MADDFDVYYIDTIEKHHIGNHINKLWDRIKIIEKRMDDLHLKNDELKMSITYMVASIARLHELSHTHFWK